MISSNVIFTLALVCVALVPAYAAVTKCHQCDSSALTGAANVQCIWGNTTAAACPVVEGTTYESCIKIVKDEGEDTEIVKKSCGTESKHTCPSGYDCYYCDEDECNSSVTIAQSIPVIGLSVVAAYLLSKFNH